MNEKKQTGKVSVFHTLAGVYLLYLAYKLGKGLVTGEGGSPVVAAIGMVVFAAIGGFLCWRSWKAYKFGLEHKDDPSTWSDEPYEPEMLDAAEEEET